MRTGTHVDPAGLTQGNEITLDAEAEAILALVHAADGPVGARQICAGLEAQGRTLSESTAARRLRELDGQGLTRPVGAKGRVVTAHGAQMVARAKRATSARLVAATEIRSAEDLLNLLRARRAIEPEAVRDATAHIGDDDIADLRKLISLYEDEIAGRRSQAEVISVEFHRRVAESAMNPIIRAVHRLVLDSNLQHVDATLDVVLIHHEGLGTSVDAHTAIVDAMEKRDMDEAGRLMQAHVEELIHETEQFIEVNGADTVTRLLMGAD